MGALYLLKKWDLVYPGPNCANHIAFHPSLLLSTKAMSVKKPAKIAAAFQQDGSTA